jgi:hypothetical protein
MIEKMDKDNKIFGFKIDYKKYIFKFLISFLWVLIFTLAIKYTNVFDGHIQNPPLLTEGFGDLYDYYGAILRFYLLASLPLFCVLASIWGAGLRFVIIAPVFLWFTVLIITTAVKAWGPVLLQIAP